MAFGTVPEVPADTPWTDLFDGKTLKGWVRRGGEAKYHVADGVIVGTTIPGKLVDGEAQTGTENTFLCTELLYGNFVLELEFKVAEGMNSGIQIRSNSYPEYRDGRVHGYQVEIDPSDRAWTGGIYDEARRGWLNDLSKNEPARNAFKHNEWNHFRIVVIEDSIKTWLNGVPAADLVDFRTSTGFIALQVHGSKELETKQVRWRSIRIQDLDRNNVVLDWGGEQLS